jgi:isocitrate dehydrogenase
MMLTHIGQGDVASKIHNAWLKTLEDGIHTGEIFREGISKEKVGTEGMTKAVIERLGAKPEQFAVKKYPNIAGGLKLPPVRETKWQVKERTGVDIGLNWDKSTDELVAAVLPCVTDNLGLQMISNRGTKVWPDGNPSTFCSDNWRLRFLTNDGEHIKTSQVVALMGRMNDAGLNFTKSVMLNTYDGVPGYTVAQGE